MKTLLYILLFGTSMSLLSQSNEVASSPVESDELKVDVSIKSGAIYFNLFQVNEIINSTYVLTKIDTDGTESLIGIQNGYKNNLNTPILYSFKDKTGLDKDSKYYLIRLDDSGSVLKSWEYKYKNQSISELDYAVNDSE